MICKGCRRDRPAEEFLWNGKRGRHIRVRICSDCAKENMRIYSATRMVGRRPEEFAEAAD